MNNEIITFTAEPTLTRLIFLKTALTILAIVAVIHLGGQWRTPPLIDYRLSLAICLILGVLAFLALTRMPLTQKLQIDYQAQKIVIGYLTLTKTVNTLEIPFERLQVKTDTSFSTISYGAKWKAALLLDEQEKYSLFNSESGFSDEQLNEFIEKVKLLPAK